MDVILKRRLIGAGVIGVIAMVVVPLFLDGPDWQEQDERPTATTSRNAEGERVVTVPLYGDPDIDALENRRTQTATRNNPDVSSESGTDASELNASRLRAEREQRARDAELELERRREEMRKQAVADRAAEQQRLDAERRRDAQRQGLQQQPTSSVATSQPVDLQGWAVQLGTFSNQDNANRLMDKLKAADWPAWITPITNRSGKTFYRVRVGPEVSREAADKSAIKLAKQYSLQPRVMELR